MAETHHDNRPLSPHLQVFRPLITMVMSIAHRITGAALYFGTVLVAWWLIAAGVTCSSSAASVRLVCRAAASKARRALRGGRRLFIYFF